MALSKWKFLLCHLLCFTSKLDCIAVSRSQYLRILVEFVKEAKIQITLEYWVLILRRGALSNPDGKISITFFPSYTQGVCLRLSMQSGGRVHNYYDTFDRHDTFPLTKLLKWYSFQQGQEIIKLTMEIQDNLMKTLTGPASWSQPSQDRSSDSETADKL